MTAAPVVIVGAGLAAATAADELRRLGYDGELLLLGEEPELPYDRPPLSKDFLRGETPRSEVLVYDAGFYAARRIEVRTGTKVVGLDLRARQVLIEGGAPIRFEKLLLTTGAEGVRPTFPGAELAGVHVVRTLADSERLRIELLNVGRVLVIGGGWLGTEIAASARQLGCAVTLAVRDDAPLVSVLGPDLGAVYAALHRAHGTEVLARTEVVALEGDGRVRAARTADGRRLAADVVVFAAGARSRTALARAAGLPVGDGIVVDELLETSAKGVFAAGDVAEGWNAFYGARSRSEHWDNAIGQGEAAAAALLGRGRPYDRIPHFFSDQYAAQLAYHGIRAGAPSAIRGRDSATLMAFWQDGAGRVVSAAEIDLHGGAHAHAPAHAPGQVAHDAGYSPRGGGHERHNAHEHDAGHEHEAGHEHDAGHAHWHGRHAAELQALIRSRTPVSRDRLLDPGVPLADLVSTVPQGPHPPERSGR